MLCILIVSVSAVSWETFSTDYYGGTPYEEATEDMLAEYALVEDMTDEEYAHRFDSPESSSTLVSVPKKNHRWRRLLFLLCHPRLLLFQLRNFLQTVLLILTRF